MAINVHDAVGPYSGVQRDEVKECCGGRFRVVLYGAYNAMGLYGSEMNGLAVLDDGERLVVLDGEAREPSGWFGATPAQAARFDEIMAMEEEGFRLFVNTHPRARHHI